jgi:hypothetical protein
VARRGYSRTSDACGRAQNRAFVSCADSFGPSDKQACRAMHVLGSYGQPTQGGRAGSQADRR